jgi:hypothetical protein
MRIAVALIGCVVATPSCARPAGWRSPSRPNEAARRVDVAIGGKPFTSYLWPEQVKKPVLDPIRSAHGTIVTRGWPLNPRPGERVDHPHHVGLWFNYENVNGLDFWNNSDAIKPADRSKMGTIVHRAIVSAQGGAERGELTTESDWVTPAGKVLLRERTQFVFAGDRHDADDRSRRDADGRAPSAWSSPTRRTACSACASRVSSNSRRTSRWSSPTSPAARPQCRRWTTPASPAST